ncbi:MAG: hypothetical protein ABR542_11240, partial [Desulfonatronovibrio sp.]
MFSMPALPISALPVQPYSPAEYLYDLVAFGGSQIDEPDNRDPETVPAFSKLSAADKQINRRIRCIYMFKQAEIRDDIGFGYL